MNASSPDGEEWLPIAGYEELYSVSNHGRVWSRPRAFTKGGLLRPALDYGGYQLVSLSRKGKVTSFRIHELVATAFHGPSDLPFVLHWDGNPSNNHISNLRWGTGRDNKADYSRHCEEGKRQRKTEYVNNNSTKTECKRGHSFTGPNLHIVHQPGRASARSCHSCEKGHGRVYRAALRGEILDMQIESDRVYKEIMDEGTFS